MQINMEQMNNVDDRYRAHFINSLSGYKSANLIGTVDQNGQQNLSIVSSVFHLGASPPLIGMIVRPHSAPRHTLENIIETGYYTVNHVNAAIYQQAHKTSAQYDKSTSEFEAVGLTPEVRDTHCAPYVVESHLQIGVKYVSHQTLVVNNTVMVIGQIIDVTVPEVAVQQDGYIDIASLDTVAVSGLDCYHTTHSLARLPYAKL
jgi:flavin reductase (DIM6/NTAB) family NADH-FMN oxidoreductase RutF